MGSLVFVAALRMLLLSEVKETSVEVQVTRKLGLSGIIGFVIGLIAGLLGNRPKPQPLHPLLLFTSHRSADLLPMRP